PMTSPIGQAVSRVDGRLKVTGAAVYAADNHPDNLAYGYLLTSTVAKGTITGMDTAAALASPGVLAVYTPFNPLKLFAYPQNQNALEPHAAVASWSGDFLTIYTVTQGVLLVVSRLATTLGVDASKIHVVNPHVGGGFGNKWGNWAQVPVTAAAARALGRPV